MSVQGIYYIVYALTFGKHRMHRILKKCISLRRNLENLFQIKFALLIIRQIRAVKKSQMTFFSAEYIRAETRRKHIFSVHRCSYQKLSVTFLTFFDFFGG
jgi:hypothetical protein